MLFLMGQAMVFHFTPKKKKKTTGTTIGPHFPKP